MLLERGSVGDSQAAEQLLTAAVVSYRECGMDAQAAEAVRRAQEVAASA
jgi:hypothetical protein